MVSTFFEFSRHGCIQSTESYIINLDDEDDDELQKVLELSRAENVEKETLLKIVAETEKQNSKTNSSEKENSRPKNNHTSDDMTKSPDPPPKPREPHPGNSENSEIPKPMNFAQKVHIFIVFGLITIFRLLNHHQSNRHHH